MKRFAAVAVCLFGFAAFSLVSHSRVAGPAQWFTNGIFIGADQGGTNSVTASNVHKISTSKVATLAYDFPSLGGASAALDTVCAESSALTLNGVVFGDQLLMGIDQVPVNEFGTINAYVSAAGAVKVRACAPGITDGGSFDMPDASYTVRYIH